MRKTTLILAGLVLALGVAWPALAPELMQSSQTPSGEIPANIKIVKHVVKDGEKLLGLAYRYK